VWLIGQRSKSSDIQRTKRLSKSGSAAPRSSTSSQSVNQKVLLGIAVWCDPLSLSGGENRRWPNTDISGEFVEFSPGKWSSRAELELKSMTNQFLR
jgi:hypothetical protein